MARLIFLLCVTSMVAVIFCCSDGLTFLNSRFLGPVIITMESADWLQCLEECSNRIKCISYNYFFLGNVCELNRRGLENRCQAIYNLVANHSWVHHTLDKESIPCHAR